MGREHDLDEVVVLLSRSRLVTLTGPAGVGKSRLAVEAAGRLASRFSDGVWFVELATVTDPGQVTHTVASALSVGEQPGEALADTLVESLRRRRLLVVLDDVEHVVNALAPLAYKLLQACAELAIVATSQEALAIAGERPWVVPPLAVPEVGAADLRSVASSPAVALFCQRAAAIRPDFKLTARTAPAVAELCRRLDGMPLAIELAAAQTAVLTPSEITARLDDRFALLSGGTPEMPARHQTLRQALDWSHDLLADDELTLLRRLSVFSGGWSLEAAEMVCAGEPIEAESVLHLLAALVAKSLVVADTSGDEARYSLLESIRHYAAERLHEAGEREDRCARHVRWCAALAERAEEELTGTDQQFWLDRLTVEQDNLRSALNCALLVGDGHLALRLAGAQGLYWWAQGRAAEGDRWLSAALAIGRDEPPALRAKALWSAGLTAEVLAEPTAVARLEECLALFRDLDDRRGCARALLLLGAEHGRGKPLAGSGLLDQAERLAREIGDWWCVTCALAQRATQHLWAGDVAAARTLLEESAAIAAHRGDKRGLQVALVLLGQVEVHVGDYRRAHALLNEGERLGGELHDLHGSASALVGLAEVTAGQGDHERASVLAQEALQLAREAAEPSLVTAVLATLGSLAHRNGDAAKARKCFEEAVSTAQDSGIPWGSAMRGLGAAMASSGDVRGGRDLLEKCLRLSRANGQQREVAAALFELAELAVTRGDHQQAKTMHHQALAVRSQISDRPSLIDSLEALGGLSCESGAYEQSARLLAAAQSLRDSHGYARSPRQGERYDGWVAAIRENLPAEKAAGAFSRGAAMSLEQAVAHATKGRGVRGRPTIGQASLTPTEGAVAALAAEGLTNLEIARRMFISPGTVKGHLAHVFAKLGVTSRVKLARELTDREG